MNFISPYSNPILEMPVWSPGSYLVRDYSRNVQNFEVISSTGINLPWKKISKNQWQITVDKEEKVTVTYKVYAFDLTVRTSYLDDKYGLISPGSVFFYIVSPDSDLTTKGDVYFLKVNVRDNWRIFTSLKKENGSYIANNFDELVDSPLGLAAPDAVDTFSYKIPQEANGDEIPCQVAIIGIKGNHDIEAFAKDLKKLQLKSIDLFGELPYDRYLWVLYVVGSGSGGLEHKFSNFSIIKRWYFEGDEKNYARLMSLESHEHFHTYNIKRIRPSQLGPFDYSQEVYTRLLWVAEGITSHYDRLFLVRCGIIKLDLYCELIADRIKDIEQNMGKYIVSLEQSSFDAWIKLYKPDENQINSTISYYLKGGIVSLFLDLEIREQTDWNKSLDVAYRFLYERYKKNPEEGFPENQFKELLEESTNTDLNEFWRKYISGTDDLDYNHYLNMIGLQLKKEVKDKKVWIGIRLKSNKKVIKSVLTNSPAMKGGLYANDKIIAINGFEWNKSSYKTLLKNIEPGEEIKFHLIRDGVLKIVDVIPEEPRPNKYEIIEIEDPTEAQNQRKEIFFHMKN